MLFNVTCSKQYICSTMMVITDTLYFVDAKLVMLSMQIQMLTVHSLFMGQFCCDSCSQCCMLKAQGFLQKNKYMNI